MTHPPGGRLYYATTFQINPRRLFTDGVAVYAHVDNAAGGRNEPGCARLGPVHLATLGGQRVWSVDAAVSGGTVHALAHHLEDLPAALTRELLSLPVPLLVTVDQCSVRTRRTGLPAIPAQRRPPAEPAGQVSVLADLDVPAPLEAWHAACDRLGVPRNPEALTRAVTAAASDAATAAYLADRRAAQ